MKKLWALPNIRESYDNHRNSHWPTNAAYLMENIDRFVDENYIPTSEDILRAKQITSGIYEEEFVMDMITYKFYDMGGHSSLRNVYHIGEIDAVIYVVNLEDYDRKLAEDNTTNSIEDSLNLFKKLLTLYDSAFWILLFNKIDIFQKKIIHKPLNH